MCVGDRVNGRFNNVGRMDGGIVNEVNMVFDRSPHAKTSKNQENQPRQNRSDFPTCLVDSDKPPGDELQRHQ